MAVLIKERKAFYAGYDRVVRSRPLMGVPVVGRAVGSGWGTGRALFRLCVRDTAPCLSERCARPAVLPWTLATGVLIAAGDARKMDLRSGIMNEADALLSVGMPASSRH